MTGAATIAIVLCLAGVVYTLPSIDQLHEQQRAVADRHRRAQVDEPALAETGSESPQGAVLWMEISQATAISGEANRWRYSATQVRAKHGGGFEPMPGGVITTELYNGIEANNTGTGIEGHGVDVDGVDYPAGFAVKPIAVGAVVPAWRVQVTDDDGERATEYRFSMVNADDGTCT